MVVMLPRTRHCEEPPEPIVQAMLSADVILAPTTKSITHTQARKRACQAGARVATMPGITERMMNEGEC